ncbi:MAG: M23 family metallopeptidase, partial [bacterium]
RSRLHPILGGYRPHLAVDYSAPQGTPVWAVADGSVASCGWSRGNGNCIILRHRMGLSTCYNHLSRFAKGIHKGARVKQRQVIAYVGSTGMSTGPHLDYRIKKDGRFINPLQKLTLPGIPVAKADQPRFLQAREELMGLLHKAPSPKPDSEIPIPPVL